MRIFQKAAATSPAWDYAKQKEEFQKVADEIYKDGNMDELEELSKGAAGKVSTMLLMIAPMFLAYHV